MSRRLDYHLDQIGTLCIWELKHRYALSYLFFLFDSKSVHLSIGRCQPHRARTLVAELTKQLSWRHGGARKVHRIAVWTSAFTPCPNTRCSMGTYPCYRHSTHGAGRPRGLLEGDRWQDMSSPTPPRTHGRSSALGHSAAKTTTRTVLAATHTSPFAEAAKDRTRLLAAAALAAAAGPRHLW